MKRIHLPRPALLLLIFGLLLATMVPVASRFTPLPDFLKGILSGSGIALELIALFTAIRHKGSGYCAGPANKGLGE